MDEPTEAYCPTCQDELTAEEWDSDGCVYCATENIWLSQRAFIKLMRVEGPNKMTREAFNDE